MTYQPLRAKIRNNNQQATSFLGKRGVDLRDLPQLLSPEFALNIKNYYITTDGGLIKREGLQSVLGSVVTQPVLMAEAYTDDLIVYAFSDKVAIFRISNGTSTVVNTYSAAATSVDGKRYGDYFFVANENEKIGRISQTLNYNAQTANFTLGAILTGGTSGATAVILEDADAGVTGTLTLGTISGTFQNGEIITDSSGGSATVNGSLSFVYTTIAAAPVAGVLQVIGNRIIAGRLRDDAAGTYYAQVDTGVNPPFDGWTTGTTATAAGKVSYRNAGPVRSIEFLGNNIIVFGDFGKWAFTIDSIDVGGVLTKVDTTVMQKQDFGGAASLVTDKGLFYVNEAGLWNIMSLGQSNVPFSQQEVQESVLLGNTYFDDVDFSNSDIAYDPTRKLILITCAKDSNTNNLIIVYNLDFKAFSFFSGWNISRFVDVLGVPYAGSSLFTKLYKVFSGYQDDTDEIWTEFYQEIKMGNLETRQILTRFFIQGFLSSSTQVKIAFDIYDRNGNFVLDKTTWLWTVQSGNNISDGFGVASWGTSSWGGDVDVANVVESFDGCSVRISNFQRVRIRLTTNDKVPHIINWFSMMGRIKAQIRRRKIVKLT